MTSDISYVVDHESVLDFEGSSNEENVYYSLRELNSEWYNGYYKVVLL
jgi:hypothetical protein